MLLKISLALSGDEDEVDKVLYSEAVVNIRVRGGQPRNGLEIEANRNNLANNWSTVHNLKLLKSLILHGIVRLSAPNILFADNANLAVLQVQIHDLEGDLAEDTLLQVEDLLVVLKLNVKDIINANVHRHSTLAKGSFAEVAALEGAVWLGAGELLVHLAHPDLLLDSRILHRTIDSGANKILHLGVDATIRFVLLVGIKTESDLARASDSVRLVPLLLVDKLRLVLAVTEGSDDTVKLQNNTSVLIVAALGIKGELTGNDVRVGVQVHLLARLVIRVIDDNSLVVALFVKGEGQVAAIDLAQQLSKEASLLLLRGALVLQHVCK